LVTAKQRDFELFCDALSLMEGGAHLSESGLTDIAQITEQMNRKGRSRFLESSEAKRRPPRIQSSGAK
jgi:hypothetical protein